MSFLLRNNNSSGTLLGQGRQGAMGDNRVFPRPKPPSKRYLASKTMKQTGNQVLIQRTVLPQPRNADVEQQRQRLKTKPPNQASTRNDCQGVISMSEVLEDLKVLEVQQREAQRKLAIARSTKEHRLQQQLTLQSKLESLKYSNGELRAQLRQSRDLLSIGTRALGTRRLATDEAGKNIREFERQLKSSLHSSRMIAASRRKADSLFLVLEAKVAILVNLRAEAKEELLQLDNEKEAEVRREGDLRNTIQKEVARAQKCTGDLSLLRETIGEAEKELFAAQDIEESTRLRSDAAASHHTSARKRHGDLVAELKVRMGSCEQVESRLNTEDSSVTVHLEERVADLQKARSAAFQCLQDLGLGDAASNENDVPIFDLEQIGRQIEGDRDKAKAKESDNETLRTDVHSMQSKLESDQERILRCNENATRLTQRAHELEDAEKKRHKELADFRHHLERERAEVATLQQSTADLKETRKQSTERHNQAVVAHEREIARVEDAIKASKASIDGEITRSDTESSSWESEKSNISKHLQECKERVKAAEVLVDNQDEESTLLEQKDDLVLREKLRDLETRTVANASDTTEAVSQILQSKFGNQIVPAVAIRLTKFAEFPRLRAVERSFVYDSSKSRREQTKKALDSLICELESEVKAAKQSHQKKLREKADARRRVGISEAKVQRREHQRRRKREAFGHPHQEHRRLSDEQLYQTTEQESSQEPHTSDPVVTDALPCAALPSRKRKGADFYHPQSQEEVPDDCTPAKPMCLFSSFASAEEHAPSILPLESTQSTDKKVRWEDEREAEHASGQVTGRNASEHKPARKKTKRKQYGRTKRGSSPRHQRMVTESSSTTRSPVLEDHVKSQKGSPNQILTIAQKGDAVHHSEVASAGTQVRSLSDETSPSKPTNMKVTPHKGDPREHALEGSEAGDVHPGSRTVVGRQLTKPSDSGGQTLVLAADSASHTDRQQQDPRVNESSRRTKSKLASAKKHRRKLSKSPTTQGSMVGGASNVQRMRPDLRKHRENAVTTKGSCSSSLPSGRSRKTADNSRSCQDADNIKPPKRRKPSGTDLTATKENIPGHCEGPKGRRRKKKEGCVQRSALAPLTDDKYSFKF